MNVIQFVVLLILLAIGMTAQWWLLRRQFTQRLEQARARHLEFKNESGKLLSAARNQTAVMSRQLEAVRMELKRVERQQPAAPAGNAPPQAVESLLLMLDEETTKHYTGDQAFADTTIGFRGANSDYTKYRQPPRK